MEEELIDLLTEELTDESEEYEIWGAVIGRLHGFADNNSPLVDFPQNSETAFRAARTTVALSAEDSGRDVVLVFENGDPQKPIITGLLQQIGSPKECIKGNGRLPKEKPLDVEIDGERMTFSAEREIVLRCGKASITLTRAGKILIRGKYLLSRSSGVNRIKGGSVQIN